MVQLAGSLVRGGIAPGDRVAILSPTRFEQPVGVEKHSITRPEALRPLQTVDFECETERRAGPPRGQLVARR